MPASSFRGDGHSDIWRFCFGDDQRQTNDTYGKGHANSQTHPRRLLKCFTLKQQQRYYDRTKSDKVTSHQFGCVSQLAFFSKIVLFFDKKF